jgi:hypothetical protein
MKTPPFGVHKSVRSTAAATSSAARGYEGSTHAARVSAWGLIGKHLGMFIERRQQLGEDGQPAHSQLFTVHISG